MKIHTFRLKEGVELKEHLKKFAQEKNLSASVVLSATAGAKEVELRMPGATPNKKNIKTFKGGFEVVSIQGTLSKEGCHIHIAISNKQAHVFGGHLEKMIVRITAEVTILEIPNRRFLRKLDEETGFKELSIK